MENDKIEEIKRNVGKSVSVGESIEGGKLYRVYWKSKEDGRTIADPLEELYREPIFRKDWTRQQKNLVETATYMSGMFGDMLSAYKHKNPKIDK